MWPFGAKAREPQAAVDPVTGAIVEDAASRAAGLAALRAALAAALAADASIRLPRDDDRFLLAFLRARKYRVSKACEVVLSFAKFWYCTPRARARAVALSRALARATRAYASSSRALRRRAAGTRTRNSSRASAPRRCAPSGTSASWASCRARATCTATR